MSENTVTGTPAAPEPAAPQPDSEQQSAEQSQSAGPRPAGASPLLRASAATVAAALAGVAIGIGVIKVHYDDAPAPVAAPAAAPVPSASATPYGAKSNGSHFGSLRDLLLPVPAGYRLGPDDGGYGNDAELGSQQLAEELDAELQQVPKAQRDKMREYWEGLHVKGTGVRTYRTEADDLLIGVKLRQFNQQEVQKINEYTAVFTGDTGLFRVGPQVPGHPEAHCYLMPAPPSAPIDYLECSAAEGDLLVIMNAEGPAPLPKDKIIALFAAQLDRLAAPGATA
ncbi:hypothetical protein [Streptomyces rubellomurinus]|uniref:Uncharacterized protein n=1 Tax=Streptomyces rubellomurinus (strain ATCC 31215) TaxID=359131 RepID=A0A0F2TCZ4_STRR3|nr:hypothetical protein [Streptomyces rubellomurinus]KJS61014.1 hypothetical protein VM95_17885 [Streptomyces rubellomurinus]